MGATAVARVGTRAAPAPEELRPPRKRTRQGQRLGAAGVGRERKRERERGESTVGRRVGGTEREGGVGGARVNQKGLDGVAVAAAVARGVAHARVGDHDRHHRRLWGRTSQQGDGQATGKPGCEGLFSRLR